MNKYIQNKLAMYKLVRQLMEENAPTWNTIPAVESVFNDLTSKIVELEKLGVKQGSKLTGFAKSKTKLKVATTEQTTAIAAALFVYAESINDDVLKAKVTLKSTSLKRGTKEQFLAKMEEIILLATELSTELVPFGVTVAHIDELNTNFDELKAQMYRVRMEIIKRKQLTNAIHKLSKQTDNTLNAGLDQLMKMIKSVDAIFYEKYKSARMIIEHGVKHKLLPKDDTFSNGLVSE
jgi:outer membrane murein-binding lipoprotein Lpp